MPSLSRHGLPTAALQHVCDLVAPDARVVRVRPLRGGISASVHLVLLATADGQRRGVVVRRYSEYWQATGPEACRREFEVLAALADSSFLAPRPLMVDSEGGAFGAPTVVMSRLPGRPLLAPKNLTSYLQQIAHLLAELHRLPTPQFGFLPDQGAWVTGVLGEPPHTEDPLLLEIWTEAASEWARVCRSAGKSALVHGDYWPGNLLWVRGRLVGLVDWEQPRLGDPTKDVATCRGDITVLFGQAAADEFLAEYEREVGAKVNHLRFWELLISTEAVPDMPKWAVGYRVLGRADLTTETAVARIRAFARAALDRR